MSNWMRALMLLLSVLVIPVVLLLFAQWPLRDWLQVGSRMANDMGQLAFGVYMATAVTAASVAGVHLASHLPGARSAASNALWRSVAVWLCVAPWAGFILWTYLPNVWQSVGQLERFPETGHPGYFMLRVAVLWMALLVLVQAVAAVYQVWRARRRSV